MRQPIPRHTCQNVDECLDVAAEDTIRNTRTAKSPPEESERFVMRLKFGPHLLIVNSLAASEAEKLKAVYPTPVLNLTTPQEMVVI